MLSQLHPQPPSLSIESCSVAQRDSFVGQAALGFYGLFVVVAYFTVLNMSVALTTQAYQEAVSTLAVRDEKLDEERQMQQMLDEIDHKIKGKSITVKKADVKPGKVSVFLSKAFNFS